MMDGVKYEKSNFGLETTKQTKEEIYFSGTYANL
jgi:hypothetical protein